MFSLLCTFLVVPRNYCLSTPQSGFLRIYRDGRLCSQGVEPVQSWQPSLLFHQFFKPGFETVGLGKGGTNNVGVRIVKHCHTQNMHVKIWLDRRWVDIVVACTDCDMHGAIFVVPLEYKLLLKLTFVMWGGSGIHVE